MKTLKAKKKGRGDIQVTFFRTGNQIELSYLQQTKTLEKLTFKLNQINPVTIDKLTASMSAQLQSNQKLIVIQAAPGSMRHGNLSLVFHYQLTFHPHHNSDESIT